MDSGYYKYEEDPITTTSTPMPPLEHTSLRGPYFDTTASKNVTALVGKTAYLNCRVRNVGNRTVRFENGYFDYVCFQHDFSSFDPLYKDRY
ncbi:hypothetical protein M8J76_005759 [Diaphorina citri]|nr:hypothetical protein M8J75_016485 [Diaphorina citri]KAI5744840.1 hypothetical protein M8J76_005759 [Diaphorina citri]KAI5752245.1 hypothetical protein M8J77_015165 [Diaphorina citri]